MNIVIKKKNYQGSALLVALMTAWVIGIALVSYLTLVANKNRSTYRSLSWNMCIPVLEAGVEEALAQIRNHAKDNLGANDWTFNTGDQRYHKSRQVYSGSYNDGSYFDVGIEPTDPRGEPNGPMIYSTGYVPGPANTGTALGGETAFGMILGTLNPFSSPKFVKREVKVTTIREGFAPGGINAKGRITFSGGAYFDSFDSGNPNYNDGSGRYDPAKRQANAKAITNLKDAEAINVGGGTIYGSVTTGPEGIVNIGDGSVGDLGWAGNTSGIQPGHQKDDANLQFDDVQPPFLYGSGQTPMPGPGLDGLLATFVLGSGNYNMGSVNLSGGRTMVVMGDATLYVNGNLSTSGGGGIIIAPGASLKIYIAGSASFTGNGIVNGSGRARNLLIYGLKTSTSFSYSGTSEFIGGVYAPNAAIAISGGAKAYGGFSGNTVNVSGGAHVAYDEDLRNLGNFIMESWNEI